jgi:hypothetical protein
VAELAEKRTMRESFRTFTERSRLRFIPLILLLGCNTAGWDAVSISPIYGWVDGCSPITISGHGFSDKATATIGGQAVTGITQPDRDLDKGYLFTATVPAATAAGYADVVVTDGENTATITGTGAYYYVACPAPGYLEALSPTDGITAGATISMTGCGFDPAAVRVQIVDSAGTAAGDAIELTPVCGTASVSFTAPALADGTWYLELIDPTGTVLSGTPCPPVDTAVPADTSDTAAACTDTPIVYGSAR